MKPPRFPRFVVGTSSSLTAITAGTCALAFVSSASALDVVHELAASSTTPWSTSTWTNGVPNAIGDIATYGTAATTPTTQLDISPTLGSLRMTAGTSWAITPQSTQAITFDGTGMSSTNNGFGNAGVASILNSSGGSNLAARVSMILDNTDLDIGVAATSTGNPALNIGSMTVNATSITNADATARSINFRLNATNATSVSTATVNSAIGAAGTGGGGLIHINNLSSGASGSITLAGNLGSLIGDVTQNSGTVRMSLSGTNTYSGNTTVTAGTLSFINRVSLYNADTAQWTSSKISVAANSTLGFGFGGAAKFSASDLATLNASSIFVANSRFGIEIATGETQTYSNAITDGNGGANSIGFVKLGAGILAVNGPSTYTGGTIISAGSLRLVGAQGATNGPLGASSGGLPTGSILFNGGTLQYTATNTTDYSSRFAIGNNAIRIDTNSQTVTFGSGISGSNSSLAKVGAGTLILTGANTYSGSTDVSGGTLRGSDSTVYTNATNTLTKVFSTGVVQIANNATLDLRANGLNDSSAQTLTYGNQIQVSATGATYNINVGRESGTGTNKTIAMGNHNVGANTTMNLTGDPGYQLSINQYQLGGAGTTSTTKLNPTTASLIIGSVGSGSNTVSPTMNLDGTSSGNVITGTIANNATPGPTGTAVLKTNTSTWSLNGTNTYTGATTVNGGNLFVNGSIAANSAGVSVGASGTLGGTGTINTTVSVTGNIAAGNISSSIGDLKVGSVNTTAALNFSSGGTYIWQMGALADDATGTAGTDFDQISLTGSGGNLVLGGTSKLMLDFAALGSDPNSADPFWLATHSWTVIDGEAGVTNTGSTNFSEVLNGSFATGSFATTADALGNVTLVFTPVPEPATAALLLGSLSLLARRRRK